MSNELSGLEIAALQNANILKLQSAARMAGLSFKNGSLGKNDLITRLCAFPSVGRATLAALERMENNLPPAPKAPVDPSGWDDDSPAETPKVSLPSPNVPKTPEGDSKAQQDLSAYVLRTDMHKWLDNYALKTAHANLQNTVQVLSVNLQKRLEGLENLRPVELKVGGEIPPIKIEGLSHPLMPDLIRILMAGENAFLKGPASSGKTTAAKQAREVLSKAFQREDYLCKATGAVSDSYALIGYKNATGEYVRTAFRDAVEHGHLFLWDEVDASADDAVLVVNSLDNGFIAFPDAEIPLHPHFRLICGGNTDGSGATMEYSGRRRMDGAFRDRFIILDWQIDPRIEESLSRGDSLWLAAVREIRAYALKNEILDVVATARATRRGPLLLAQGMSRKTILEATCKRGALIEAWETILRLPSVSRYLSA